MIIYLDYDGVLHDENVIWAKKKGIHMATPGRTLFEWETVLVDLLAPHPDVQIVLSTSWVRVKGFSYAKSRLSKPLQERVVGATFHKRLMVADAFAAMSRGMQVWGDVSRRQPDKWIAIDDDRFGWPRWCRDHLVLTDERLGVSSRDTQDEIRRRLST